MVKWAEYWTTRAEYWTTTAMGRILAEANPPGLMVLKEAISPLAIGDRGLVHCTTALTTGFILMGMTVLAHMVIVMTPVWMMSLILASLTLRTNLRRILLI